MDGARFDSQHEREHHKRKLPSVGGYRGRNSVQGQLPPCTRSVGGWTRTRFGVATGEAWFQLPRDLVQFFFRVDFLLKEVLVHFRYLNIKINVRRTSG